MSNFSFTSKNRLFDFVYLFMGVFGFNMLFLILVYSIYNKPFFEESELSYLTISTFAMYVLVWPLLEELCFRGILVLPKSKHSIYLFVLGVVIVTLLYTNFSFTGAIIAVLACFMLILYLYSEVFKQKIDCLITNHIYLLIVTTSVLFAWAHITNHDTRDLETYLKLIPIFISGLYFGYIAYKYGVSKSYMMHGINNLIPFICLLVIKCFFN